MRHLVKIPFNQHVDMFISKVTDTHLHYEKRNIEDGKLAEPPVVASYYIKDKLAFFGNTGNADSFIDAFFVDYAKEILTDRSDIYKRIMERT